MTRQLPFLGGYAAVLLAFLLRVYQLGADGFIGDEAFTALLARQPFSDIIASSLRSEPHPPTHTIMLWVWRPLVGESEFALRFPVAFAGTLCVPLLFCLGKVIGGPHMGLAAAFLAAGNPFLVRFSQLGRMYSAAATGALASALLFAQGLRRGQRPGPNYFLISLLGMSFHYFSLLTLAAQGLLALAVRPSRPLLWSWVGAQALVGVIPLFWLGLAWPLLQQLALTWLTANMPPEQLFLSFLGGSQDMQPLALGLGVIAAVLAILGLFWIRRSVWGLFAPLLTLLPFALVHMLSAMRGHPMVLDRYLIVMVPGLLLWLAQGFLILPRALVVGALALILVAWLPALQSYYKAVGISTSAEMRALRRDMAAGSADKPLVLSNLAASDPYFHWYVPSELPIISSYAVPLDYAHTVSFDPSRVERDFRNALSEHRQVWLLGLGYPSAPAAVATEQALEASSYRLSERWYGSVRWLRYSGAQEDVRPIDLRFQAPEGLLRVTAYSLTPDLAPGYLGLRLDWRSEANVAGAYGVFVHLLDSAGNKLAQGDSDPQWGYAPTTGWQPGQTIIDRHVVPLPAEADGAYRITLGLYDDRGRLHLPGGDNAWTTPPFDLQARLTPSKGLP